MMKSFQNLKQMGKGVVKVFCVLLLFSYSTYAQQGNIDPLKILENAMSKLQEPDYVIYYEGLALGTNSPTAIFTMPKYKIYRGGYFIVDNEKFELSLGLFKGLSDGKLVVYINEAEKSIMIDSVRATPLVETGDADPMVEYAKMMDFDMQNIKFNYEGKEKVNGHLCYKIKSNEHGKEKRFACYYVKVKDSKILLMSDFNGVAYDNFWIKEIKNAPKNHKFDIKNIPNTEISTLAGYKATDMRFVRKWLNKKR
jgi:hypothetical protein